MVLTRKRAAAPSSSKSDMDVSTTDSTGQSNLSLLASSASCEVVNSSAESPAPTVLAPAAASSSGCGLDRSSGSHQAGASEHTIQPGSVSALVSSSNVIVSGEMQLSPSFSDQKSVAQPRVTILPPSAVVSPGAGTTEGEVPFSGSVAASQVQLLPGTASASGGGAGVEQPAVVRYKIVYQSMQSGPGTVPAGKQPGASAAVNVGLTSLFPPKTFTATTRPSLPTAYTILAAPNKGGSTPRHILVPVSRAVPASPTSGTSLLTSGSLLRPPKPATVGINTVSSTSMSLLTSPAPTLSVASPPTATPVAKSSAAVKISPTTTSAPVLLPTTPILLHTTTPQPVMPNSVSHALFKLANSAKAAMTTSVGVVSSTFSALPTVASSASSPLDVSSSIAASTLDHSPALSATEEGETTMSWDKESTLKLIRLYKEHQAYLNDHHYKKKSVRLSFFALS